MILNDVKNSLSQLITISVEDRSQSINVENKIDVQDIQIRTPWVILEDLDAYIKKDLSILPDIKAKLLNDAENRKLNIMYIDAQGVPSQISIEQIKNLNTKIILVDDLDDKNITTLSNDDFILLKE